MADKELTALAQMLHADLLRTHPGTTSLNLCCVMGESEDMVQLMGCKYKAAEVVRHGEELGYWTRNVKTLNINPTDYL
jgi:hypothetical protein